jgi:uncharacterized protein YbjT (DUF2867 family)
MNIELAKAAKESGIKTYVIISSAGASPTSNFAYPRMKGEIEEHVKELGFDRTVILRPGMITGYREESRFLETAFKCVAGAVGKIHSSLEDPWAQGADVIGRAAVQAGLAASEGKVPEGSEKVWIVGGSDIIRLGKTEWKDGA